MQKIENSILQKAANGDEDAFEQIYAISSGFVYTVAYRIVNDPEKSKEVTQEVFLKIYRHLKKFKFRSSFKTWLYRITVNTAINVAKRYKKYSQRVVSYNDTFSYNQLPKKEGEISFAADNKESIQCLLEILNPEQRACIILREIEGLSYKEIALALKTNINTVRTRLLRARQKLMNSQKSQDKKGGKA